MKILANVLLVLVVAVGALWSFQGANIIGGTAMSARPEWLIAGVMLAIVGLVGLWWFNLRRPTAR